MANNDYTYLTTSDGTRIKPVTDLAAINLITKDGIEVSSNTIKLKASVSGPSAALGGVIINQGVDHGIKLVNSSGTVSVSAGLADSSGGFGVVTIGSNISISNGTASIGYANSAGGFGVVTIGSNINVSNGTVSIATATSAGGFGVVTVGSNINVSNGTVSIANADTNNPGVVQLESDISGATGTALSRPPTVTAVKTYVANKINEAALSPGTVEPATDGVAGIVRLATDVEASAGTATDVAITPSGVSIYVAKELESLPPTPGTVEPGTDEVAGIVRFATEAEATAGTASDVAMTPAGVAAYIGDYITFETV